MLPRISYLYLLIVIRVLCNPKDVFKMLRKPASENVVCLCCLLNILANFSNLFLHTGKQCGPGSDLGPQSLRNDF